MRWFYLYFPSLQLDQMLVQMQVGQEPSAGGQEPSAGAEKTATGSLAGRSGAIVLYDPKQQTVTQVSGLARTAGIREGMALSDCWLLCEDLAAFPYRASMQRQVLYQTTRLLYRYVALICPDHPHGLWLEASSMRRLYSSEEHLLSCIDEQLGQHGIHYRSAISRSSLAAQIHARTGTSSANQVPVKALPCSPRLIQKMERMGVKTIADALKIPRSALGGKLGKEIVQVLAEYQGHRVLPMACFQPPTVFYQRLVLLADVHDWQGLRFPMKRLLNDLAAFLELRQQQTQRLQISLSHRDAPPTRLTIGMAHGCWRADDFMHLCQLKMENYELKAPVTDMSLYTRELSGRNLAEADLWNHSKHRAMPSETSLGQLLNQLQLRLGEAQVRGIQVVHHWVPEQSWEYTAGAAHIAPTPLMGRPFWVLENPELAQPEQWTLVAGPERIESGWWSGETTCRDYYKAVNREGASGWLFYDRLAQKWWLHGWFS